jgi:hypothetical protein
LANGDTRPSYELGAADQKSIDLQSVIINTNHSETESRSRADGLSRRPMRLTILDSKDRRDDDNELSLGRNVGVGAGNRDVVRII